MSSPHENQLRTQAKRLIPSLAKRGIIAQIDEASFRDYHVKLRAEFNGKAVGNIILYFAPTKNEFTVKCHELTVASLATWVDECFATLGGGVAEKPKPATSTAKGIQVYVDGSYINGRVGFGAIILKDGEKLQEFFGRVHEDTSTRQVAGELVATMTALDWCKQNGVATVDIFYDYTGIEKWARKKWQANLPLTQRYQLYMQETPIKIRFRKVESHTGNFWNEAADQLAKKGALS